ncbi:MAG TPA: peptidoglycan-binding protein [Alphaproteobacteria bacterium]
MRTLVVLAGVLLLAACAGNQRTSTLYPAQATSIYAQPSAEIRDTQEQLRAAGMYVGPIDGLWGPDTRSAVERFQQSRGLAVTGRLDEPTRIALRRVNSATPVSLTDPTDVRAVQNRLRQLNYYRGPADGVWGPHTQAAIEDFQRSRGLPVGQVTEATVAAMGLDPAEFRNVASAPTYGTNYAPAYRTASANPLDPAVVRGIQQHLRQLGFYTGRVDGVWGARTQAALERFQKSRGLEATGSLNPTTAQALGLDPNNLSLSAVPHR